MSHEKTQSSPQEESPGDKRHRQLSEAMNQWRRSVEDMPDEKFRAFQEVMKGGSKEEVLANLDKKIKEIEK